MLTDTTTARTMTVHPGPRARTVRDAAGAVLDVPAGWDLLPPGDALLTRNVKAGAHWVVVEQRGSKRFSRGVWAPAEAIARATALVERRRASPEHARQLDARRARRAGKQADYVVAFTRHVLAFLAFHARHAAVAQVLAARVAEHATPVGSGTVARTERIPVAERAEAAVIAWMRHQTTAYDRMSIARVKGERREVRRKLAARSRELLERYRRGGDVAADCPLAAALASVPSTVVRVLEAAHEVETAHEAEQDLATSTQLESDGPARAVVQGDAAPERDVDLTDERLARMRAVRQRLERRSTRAR